MFLGLSMFEDIICRGLFEDGETVYPIYAHRDADKKELYNEHVDKTWTIFKYLLESQEDIVRDLFEELKNEFSMSINYSEFKVILHDLVLFHDIGKVNPKFQVEKLDNKALRDIKMPNGTTTQHSYPGAFILTTKFLEHYEVEDNLPILTIPYLTLGHHTRLRNPHESCLASEKFEKPLITSLHLLKKIFGFSDEELEKIINRFGDEHGGLSKKFLDQLESTKSSSLSILYNLVYSFLVLSDFIATSYAYKELEAVKNDLPKFNRRIDQNILKRMKEKFDKKQDEYRKGIAENELNRYRQEMLEEARENLKLALETNKRVFYLKMPTSGGKTNTSLNLALDILEKKETNRLIYALPYITILEQNYEFLQKAFDLEEPDEIRQIYSGTETIFKGSEDEREKILTDDDFYNYPVICTTNVSLFNSIVKFSKRNKYRFSSLSNSVIILDEIQSLPPEYWPEFNFLINELAEKLNIYFIIMSATVPSLEKLKHLRKQDPKYEKEVCYLITNPDKYFFKFKRNEIITKEPPSFDISDSDGESKLKNYLKNISEENFENANNHGLIVLNTVQTSQIVYDLISELSEEDNWETDIMLLNSTFLPIQKRDIIKKINNLQDDARTILISTQSVEAGMDVSFNFVIRDFAILDSIEQVRGRCNRHKEKESGNVYVIKIKRGNKYDHTKIYDRWRIETTKEVLMNKNFQYDFHDIESYYDKAIEYINKELMDSLRLTSADNLKCWNMLKFEESNSPRNREKQVFHVDVIEENQNSFSFFVETQAPFEHFTEREIDYLRKNQNKSGIILISNGKILGSGLITYHALELEKLKDSNFTTKKLFKREMSSILSKFAFSVVLNADKNGLDVLFENDRVGFYYVIREEKVGEDQEKWYSISRGLNRCFLNKLLGGDNFI
jgi:CRISPR-associated endonuclease/helicase Cas3